MMHKAQLGDVSTSCEFTLYSGICLEYRVSYS